MQIDPLQFYPTPFALAAKAWSLFTDKDFVRVLEPSAGNGDLLAPFVRGFGNRLEPSSYRGIVDVIEMDASKHPGLEAKGARVVGHDFLEFTALERYSHIIMNPPFAAGAQHLLHAWNHLYDGEIVCILNAETLKNPFSKERKHLLSIVEQHGSVEYVQSAFEDAQRRTSVEVALVHLTKRADTDDVLGDLLAELREDHRDPTSIDMCYAHQLALPQGLVEDAVLRFNAAAKAALEAAQAQVKATHYARMIGKSLHEADQRQHAQVSSGGGSDPNAAAKAIRAAYANAYDSLKDRAWTSILRSTTVLSKLSSRAQRRLESDFERIKRLEFTAKNIYGFLQGLSESAGSIQMDMVLDVFDDIVRYHEDNTVFYMGWKSNGRHRTAGMRLKTTRFILPGHSVEGWHESLPYQSQRMLEDFDKVFAMLDGKHVEQVRGLASVFADKAAFKRLKGGARESSDYFDVRYYPKRGTIHFFPKRKDLMDRLNRLVGQHRQWLPPEHGQANEDFHAQYEQAEKWDAEFREAFENRFRSTGRTYGRAGWALDQVVRAAMRSGRGEEDSFAMECARSAMEQVMEQHGWRPEVGLSSNETSLLDAA